MRVLRFIVDNTTIREDPSCDFSGLFPGRNDEVMAEFEFSKEWKSAVKVVAFWSLLGAEYPPRELNEDDTCMIPIEALRTYAFKMQIIGKVNGKRKETKKFMIRQSGGKV